MVQTEEGEVVPVFPIENHFFAIPILPFWEYWFFPLIEVGEVLEDSYPSSRALDVRSVYTLSLLSYYMEEVGATHDLFSTLHSLALRGYCFLSQITFVSLKCLDVSPEESCIQELYRGHTQSEVVYTCVHSCVHAGTQLYTHVYTRSSQVVGVRWVCLQLGHGYIYLGCMLLDYITLALEGFHASALIEEDVTVLMLKGNR